MQSTLINFRQVIRMPEDPEELVDGSDPIKNGLGSLLLTVVKKNFILLKFLLSEDLYVLWTRK